MYDGDVTIGELLEHGDFGLGTFNHLDGEMLILDGVCYHLRADGTARVAEAGDLTPFAAVTWFAADTTLQAPPGSDRAAVTALIDGSVTSENLLYAVRITGAFGEIRTRTVREQKSPYPPLTQATQGQQETTFNDVTGLWPDTGHRTTSRASPWPATTCTSSTPDISTAATPWTTGSRTGRSRSPAVRSWTGACPGPRSSSIRT